MRDVGAFHLGDDMRAVACQGFAGAFALGVKQSGFELVASCERDGAFGAPMLEANRHLLGDDWEAYEDEETWPDVHDVDLVFGNPPCSGFSGLSVCINIGNGIRADWRKTSSINECMWTLVRYGARLQARAIVFESVQMAYTKGKELMRALHAELEDLTGHEYQLTHVLQNDLSLGGASMRKRYFWVATRYAFGVDIPLLRSPLPTLRDCIGDLEEVPIGFGDEAFGHVVHDCARTRRMSWLASHVDWNEGEASGIAAARYNDRLPDEWFHKDGRPIRTELGDSMYAPRRLAYDKPAPVLRGYGLTEYVHPTLPRNITFREAARIMGYSDDWSVAPAIQRGSVGSKWFGKQIPVAAGRWIASWIRQSAEGRPGPIGLGGSGERVIDVTHAWKAATR